MLGIKQKEREVVHMFQSIVPNANANTLIDILPHAIEIFDARAKKFRM
jgi:hypothetical protein